MRILILLTLSLLTIIPLQAKGKKSPTISITFHLEASGRESKKFAVPVETPRGKRFIQRVPTMSTKDIAAYRPFGSPHNANLYGIILQLNKNGANRLRAISGQNLGSWMVASVNGRVVDMMHIDKAIDGRLVTIWRGIDPDTIRLLDDSFPRIGEDPKVWKERLKRAKKNKKN